MTTEMDTLATALYVRADDLLKESPHLAPERPAVSIAPQLSDAELVTLAVLQALLGFESESRWIRFARATCLRCSRTCSCSRATDPAGRRPQDIIAPPGGRHGTREPRPGPKARNKWLAGSVRRNPAEMIAAMFDEAEAREPLHARTWAVLVDGAEHQLNLIGAEATRRGVAVHVLIDIIHVLEYIWGAAWALHESGDPAAEDWVAVRALAVLAGDSDRAAQEIAAEADAAGLKGSRRTGIDAYIRYLTGKHEFLRYDQALQDGWPIATGVIEGACRHLIADRLNLGGARWGLDGAEAVLILRAVIANGDFEEYWAFHLACEHERLYPGVNQGQYTLGA